MGVCNAERKEEEEEVAEVAGGGEEFWKGFVPVPMWRCPVIDELFLLRLAIEDIDPGERGAFDERVVVPASRSFLLPVGSVAFLSLPWVGDGGPE